MREIAFMLEITIMLILSIDTFKFFHSLSFLSDMWERKILSLCKGHVIESKSVTLDRNSTIQSKIFFQAFNNFIIQK